MATAPTTCSVVRRIGPARAVTFGAASSMVPSFVHGAPSTYVLLVGATISVVFAAWSWRLACSTRRSPLLLASTIGLAQLVVHGAYAASPTTTAVQHAHHAPDGAATLASMLVVHLIAAALGAMVIAALDRRAMRAIRIVLASVRRALRPVTFDRARGSSPGLTGSIAGIASLHADARRIRVMSRSHARRGPPVGSFTTITT